MVVGLAPASGVGGWTWWGAASAASTGGAAGAEPGTNARALARNVDARGAGTGGCRRCNVVVGGAVVGVGSGASLAATAVA
jgi:hypothetical protein